MNHPDDLHGTDRTEQDSDDMHARRLLGMAGDSLPIPYGSASAAQVDAVLRHAGRIRRRRRFALVGGSAVAVAAVALGTALMPRADGSSSALGDPPASSASPSASASAAPSATVRTGTPSPSASASGLPQSGVHGTGDDPEPPRTSARPTAPSKAASPPPSRSTTTTGTPATTGPAALVTSLLPPGTGTVRREADRVTPSYTPNPLSGRYLLTKNGKTAYLDITVVDMKVNANQQRPTMAQERATNHCEDFGVVAPNTDCAHQTLSDGSLLSTYSAPGNQQEPGSDHVSGPGYDAWIIYPNGNQVEIYASSGITGPGGLGPRYDQPPLTKDQLASLVKSGAWFRSP